MTCGAGAGARHGQRDLQTPGGAQGARAQVAEVRPPHLLGAYCPPFYVI